MLHIRMCTIFASLQETWRGGFLTFLVILPGKHYTGWRIFILGLELVSWLLLMVPYIAFTLQQFGKWQGVSFVVTLRYAPYINKCICETIGRKKKSLVSFQRLMMNYESGGRKGRKLDSDSI